MKQRLHIIISNYDDIHNPYYSGGGAHAMHEIGKRLAKHHVVTILVGKYRGSRDEVIDNVEYKHIGMSWGGPLVGQITFALSLPFILRTSNFDVWFENFVPPHSTNMLPLFTRKPVIGITTLLDARKFSEKYHIPFHFIENRGLKVYRYFIAFSQAMESRIRQKNTDAEIRVIPDGVSAEYLKRKVTEKPYIYFLGRLDIFQKGLDVLLEAWKQVSKKYPGMKLVLAGEGTPNDHKKLMQQATSLQLRDTVSFIGRINGKQKNTLMSESLAAVFPSRFESFGIAPLEAMASGKPMVCFDIEGFRWIDPAVCLKVKPSTANALAQALEKIIREKTLRNALGKKARKFAMPYTWDNIARQYETFALSVQPTYHE